MNNKDKVEKKLDSYNKTFKDIIGDKSLSGNELHLHSYDNENEYEIYFNNSNLFIIKEENGNFSLRLYVLHAKTEGWGGEFIFLDTGDIEFVLDFGNFKTIKSVAKRIKDLLEFGTIILPIRLIEEY